MVWLMCGISVVTVCGRLYVSSLNYTDIRLRKCCVDTRFFTKIVICLFIKTYIFIDNVLH